MRLSYATFVLFYLCCSLSILGCSGSGNDPQIRPADPTSGEQLYQWMKTRVDIMVRHKANCSDMAQALIKSQREAASQLDLWRAQGAGEWLKLNAQRNPKFDHELTRLIAKGDLVYYHCAYQAVFRQQLANETTQ